MDNAVEMAQITTHAPEIKGGGLSCWIECPECPNGKVIGDNGAIVGSRQKMEIVARHHVAQVI